jgi:hypothetical protein
MTVDYGRDGKSDREDYVMGIKNLGDLLAAEGIDLDEHIRSRHEENEKLEEAGLPVPHWQGMNFGNAQPPEEMPDDPETEDAAEVK